MKLELLEELTISSQYELYGDKLYYTVEECLYSIQLPSTLKKVNGKQIHSTKITSYI